jgi:LCP family protein required for cell wall assembly
MSRPIAVILGIALLVAVAVIAYIVVSPRSEDPSANASAGPSGTAAPSADPEALERRWTVLFVGTDLNERRENAGEAVNADAIMLASLSADQSELTLVSLPRDTVDLPLPGGGTHDGKINALYREQGVEAMVGVMEELSGVAIDAHVVLDMDDFASLVEAVGGVEVSPAQPLTDEIVDLDLEPGSQELTADQALGYVRTRIDQDYGRMARQQEVLVELVARLVERQDQLDLRALLDGLESLETDLALDQLPTLIELARRATDAEVNRLVIGPPLITFEGDRGDGRGYILEPDVEAIRSEVQGMFGE